MMMSLDKTNLKFAVVDTIAATPLNLFINFVLISLGLHLGMTAAEMTFFITAVLFVLAVIRKYILRSFIDKRDYRYGSDRT
jgi:O-antigen/teichoic acid export membrane protein